MWIARTGKDQATNDIPDKATPTRACLSCACGDDESFVRLEVVRLDKRLSEAGGKEGFLLAVRA